MDCLLGAPNSSRWDFALTSEILQGCLQLLLPDHVPLSAGVTFAVQLCFAFGFNRSPFFLLHLVILFLLMRASSCLMLFHVMARWI